MAHFWPDFPIKRRLESLDRLQKIRARLERYRTPLSNIFDRLICLHPFCHNQKHRNHGGGSLHSCRTMYKYRSLFVLVNDLIDDLEGHEFHITNLLLLQIVIDREPILPLDRMDEREIFRTIKNGVDILVFQKRGILRGLQISEPEARKNQPDYQAAGSFY